MIAQSETAAPLRSLRQMRQEQRHLHRAAVNRARQIREPVVSPPIFSEDIATAIRAQIGSANALQKAGQLEQAQATAMPVVWHLLQIAWRLTCGRPKASPEPSSIPLRLFQHGRIDKPSMRAMRAAARGDVDSDKMIEQARCLLALVLSAPLAEAQKKAGQTVAAVRPAKEV